MAKDENTNLLVALQRIEDKLQHIADLIEIGNRETIRNIQQRVIGGSAIRQKILEICDGKLTVTEIAKKLERSIQQTSNYLAHLHNAGLIKEIKIGKEKRYERIGK